MAEITARFTAGATIAQWTDPPNGGRPTRINPAPDHPHLRHTGDVGVEVEITGTTGGVEGELDVNLGGQLFVLDFAEVPHLPRPAISGPAGQSSVQRFTPLYAGHYTARLYREDHGAVFLHIDVS